MKKLLLVILLAVCFLITSCTSTIIEVKETKDIKFIYKQPYRKIIVFKYNGQEYIIHETNESSSMIKAE